MLNMPQYEADLTIQGIIYAHSITDFDQKFYVEIVKMAPGAVGFLICKATEMIKQRKPKAKGKGKGKATVHTRESGDENVFAE